LATHGPPEIFNTDQGVQFTSRGFTKFLYEADVLMSMDGKAGWVGTMFVECFWRSVPYGEVYLKAYGSPHEAETQLEQYFHFYNTARPTPGIG